MAEESKYESSLLSQDIIDQLISEDPVDVPAQPAEITADAEDSSMDLISEDEIEKLMNSASLDSDSSPGGESTGDDSGLISQDDLDSLFNSVEKSTPDDDVDGLVSQGDIDSLLSEVPQEEAGTVDEDDLSLISQNDIDQLISGALDMDGSKPADPSPEPGQPEPAEDAGGDIDGLVSQDDIENLLNAGAPEEEAVTEDDLGMISQGDIDSLLNASPEDTPAEGAATEEDEPGMISQDDIDSLLNAAPEEGPAEEAAAEAAEGEAGMISQDDIDSLLNSGPDDISTEAPLSLEDDSSMISQTDIDDLLNADTEAAPAAEDDDDAGMVSQSDIDRLMNEALLDDDEEEDFMPAGDTEEDDALGLVSQDAIDDLLKGDSIEIDDDLLEEAPLESVMEEAEVTDKVILDEPEAEEAGTSKKAWYKSKILIGAAACLTILVGGFFGMYLYFTKEPPMVLDPGTATDNIQVAGKKTPRVYKELIPPPPKEMPETEEKAPAGGVILASMEGFVVLAPENAKKLNYIMLDISFDLSSNTADKLNKNKAYYRSIVFQAINKAIVQNTEEELKEEYLQSQILTALKNALPGEAIESVFVSNFKAG